MHPPPRRWRALTRTALTETIATARSALWPLAHLHRMPAAPATPTRPPIVLVHGYLGHPAMWRPLMRRLYLDGWGRVVTVGYPSTAWPLPRIVAAIERRVRAVDEPVVLIGHSLGAVASRAYIKAFGGAPFVRQFISLGGPHAGTALFRLVPPNLREVLNPDGPWVRRLNHDDEPVPTSVIRARYDHQVLPPVRASLSGVREVVLHGHGHNGLLWARDAHDAVIAELRLGAAAAPISTT